MKQKFIQPKVVHIYPNPSEAQCPVRLYEKFVGLLPTTLKHDALYMQLKVRTTPKCWYIDRPVGINYKYPTVNHLCALIGRTDGNYVNQSLCAMSATRLTNENVDNQVIKEFTGHRSNATELYKHLNDKQHRQASTIIQERGPVSTVSKPPAEESDSNVQTCAMKPVKVVKIDKNLMEAKSDMSDFEMDKINICTPLKAKIDRGEKHLHDISDLVELCSLVSAMSEKKSTNVSK